jgi:hypothetical protein
MAKTRSYNGPAFEVVVDNVGTVYSGSNFMVASAKFASYVKLSREGSGRAAGESVTLFHNGEIRQEHIGALETARNESKGF